MTGNESQSYRTIYYLLLVFYHKKNAIKIAKNMSILPFEIFLNI